MNANQRARIDGWAWTFNARHGDYSAKVDAQGVTLSCLRDGREARLVLDIPIASNAELDRALGNFEHSIMDGERRRRHAS